MEKCNCAAKLVTPEKMEHNIFDTKLDIVANVKDFLNNIKQPEYLTDTESNTDEIENISNQIHFPIFMFINPKVN